MGIMGLRVGMLPTSVKADIDKRIMEHVEDALNRGTHDVIFTNLVLASKGMWGENKVGMAVLGWCVMRATWEVFTEEGLLFGNVDVL